MNIKRSFKDDVIVRRALIKYVYTWHLVSCQRNLTGGQNLRLQVLTVTQQELTATCYTQLFIQMLRRMTRHSKCRVIHCQIAENNITATRYKENSGLNNVHPPSQNKARPRDSSHMR